MIYGFLKGIIKVALFVFFKKMVVTGRENIPESGPLIIVCNHPNTLMDPLIIAAITPHRIGFIANAGIFANGMLASILRFFHVVPIYRKKDVQEGEKPDNEAAFVKCHEYLLRKGTLLIFPEGTSQYELKLREIKTGTARIALSYENLGNFERGLSIVPITLDYSDSLQFRSMISIRVNPPISVTGCKDAYLKDEYAGVSELTENIRKELAQNIPQTIDKDQEDFLIKMHRFLTTFKYPSADLYSNPEESFKLRIELSNVLPQWVNQSPKLYEKTAKSLNKFYESIALHGLTAGFFTKTFNSKSKFLVYLGYILTLLVLLPVFLAGLITNYLPYILPSKIFEMLKVDIEYKTSIALVVGLITFPLFYTLEIVLFQTFISADLWPLLCFALLLPILGYVTMYYWVQLNRFLRVIRYHYSMDEHEKRQMFELMEELMAALDHINLKSR